MSQFSKYLKLGTNFLIPVQHTNPAKIGYVRRLCVLYVIGRFGFSSKVIFEFLLQLPREAINKLFRKLVVDGFINERKSFGSKDGAVFYLSAKGKRYLSYEVDMEFNQKTDTSAHNSKTEIHDLSIQICVINRLVQSNGQYDAFITEKELREHGYGTFGELKHERAVDALIHHKGSETWHALELECSNRKNQKTATTDLRADILKKYVNQLDNPNGLYTRVLFYSHRERFLRQITARIEQIADENKHGYSKAQKQLIERELKYIHSFCPTLYNIFWEPNYKLEKITHKSIDLDTVTKLLDSINESKQHNQTYKDGYVQALTDLKLFV